MFFNYSKKPPYCHYGVVNAESELIHYQAVALPGPRLPHDMAVSRYHSVLCDFPLFWDPILLQKGIHATRFYPDMPSRFGIVDRHGGAVRWFEASATFVLHFLNCFEEGDELVLDGYRQLNPMPSATHPAAPDAPAGHERMMVYVDMHAMQPRLHRWRFNLVTGQTTECTIDESRTMEFGVFNPRMLGEPYRFVYSLESRPGWFLFTGVVKTDLLTGEVQNYQFAEGQYISEAPFCPRQGQAEDDGYLVTIVTDMNANRSEVVLLDARDVTKGPVVRLLLPHRVCSGTHSTWSSDNKMVSRVTPSKL